MGNFTKKCESALLLILLLIGKKVCLFILIAWEWDLKFLKIGSLTSCPFFCGPSGVFSYGVITPNHFLESAAFNRGPVHSILSAAVLFIYLCPVYHIFLVLRCSFFCPSVYSRLPYSTFISDVLNTLFHVIVINAWWWGYCASLPVAYLINILWDLDEFSQLILSIIFPSKGNIF